MSHVVHERGVRLAGRPAFVLLEDGTWYPGEFSTPTLTPTPTRAVFGEVVFTTSLTGYQETFTDPSYLGQIVVMTAPMIGNYGINTQDLESERPQISGVVVRELSRTASSWRASGGLGEWLGKAGVPIIEGVDTRKLTRHIRSKGAMRGVIAEGTQPTAELLAQLRAAPEMEGRDLASQAGTRESYSEGVSGPHVVAYDFGMKRNIVRMLAAHGCRVTVVPSDTSAAEVRALEPDGVFLSNGPGDPAALGPAIANIRELASSGVPTFGICLGHQLLGLAFGGHTAKMPYGHRGGNHPVKDLATGKVLITSQNHGFSVQGTPEGIPGAPDLEVTHLNLNDQTVEGLRHKALPVFAVQYHPEASPGPHDAHPHFDQFLELMASGKRPKHATP